MREITSTEKEGETRKGKEEREKNIQELNSREEGENKDDKGREETISESFAIRTFKYCGFTDYPNISFKKSEILLRLSIRETNIEQQKSWQYMREKYMMQF